MAGVMRYLFALLCTLWSAPAFAQPPSDILDMTVRPGWRGADGVHYAALHLRMKPGWKTYWRAPGDAGISPRFDLSGSFNVKAFDVIWPKPKVVWIMDIRSIVYNEEVILPLAVTPTAPGPMRLNGTVNLGVCKEVCIPMSVAVDAMLPAQGRKDVAISNAIAAQVPVRKVVPTCTMSPTKDAMTVAVHVPKGKTTPPEVVIEVAEPGLWVSEPMVEDAGTHWAATVEVLSPTLKPTAIARSGVVTTVFDGAKAYAMEGCKAP